MPKLLRVLRWVPSSTPGVDFQVLCVNLAGTVVSTYYGLAPEVKAFGVELEEGRVYNFSLDANRNNLRSVPLDLEAYRVDVTYPEPPTGLVVTMPENGEAFPVPLWVSEVRPITTPPADPDVIPGPSRTSPPEG